MSNWFDRTLLGLLMFIAVTGVTAAVCAVIENKAVSTPAPKPAAKNTLNAVATAYCPCALCCGDSADGLTATGASALSRGIAADWRIVGPGEILDVPGYGIAAVDDTGAAMRRATESDPPYLLLDLRFPSHKEALQWGRKSLTVTVIEPATSPSGR